MRWETSLAYPGGDDIITEALDVAEEAEERVGDREMKAAICCGIEDGERSWEARNTGSLQKTEGQEDMDSFLGLLEGTQPSPPLDLSSSETHVYLNFQPSELQVIKLHCFAPLSVVICFSSSRRLVQHMETARQGGAYCQVQPRNLRSPSPHPGSNPA